MKLQFKHISMAYVFIRFFSQSLKVCSFCIWTYSVGGPNANFFVFNATWILLIFLESAREIQLLDNPYTPQLLRKISTIFVDTFKIRHRSLRDFSPRSLRDAKKAFGAHFSLNIRRECDWVGTGDEGGEGGREAKMHLKWSLRRMDSGKLFLSAA